MPQRGEVWMVDLGMVAKVRPVLILSQPFTDADRALITVIPPTRNHCEVLSSRSPCRCPS